MELDKDKLVDKLLDVLAKNAEEMRLLREEIAQLRQDVELRRILRGQAQALSANNFSIPAGFEIDLEKLGIKESDDPKCGAV